MADKNRRSDPQAVCSHASACGRCCYGAISEILAGRQPALLRLPRAAASVGEQSSRLAGSYLL